MKILRDELTLLLCILDHYVVSYMVYSEYCGQENGPRSALMPSSEQSGSLYPGLKVTLSMMHRSSYGEYVGFVDYLLWILRLSFESQLTFRDRKLNSVS